MTQFNTFKTIYEKIKELKASINYCKLTLSYNIENWERKEYTKVLIADVNELFKTYKHLKKIKTFYGKI